MAFIEVPPAGAGNQGMGEPLRSNFLGFDYWIWDGGS